MRRLLKKRITVLAALLIAAVTAIAAYAYFTANGSGSATATVGTSSTVTLHGMTSGTLYPGSTVSVSFTADNPSTGHQQLGAIYLAGVKACTGAGSSRDPSLNSVAGGCSNSGTEQTTCESVDSGSIGDANSSNFYMADVVENQDLAGGTSGVSVTNPGTLKLNNLSSSQDSCKNASLYLQLAIAVINDQRGGAPSGSPPGYWEIRCPVRFPQTSRARPRRTLPTRAGPPTAARPPSPRRPRLPRTAASAAVMSACAGTGHRRPRSAPARAGRGRAAGVRARRADETPLRAQQAHYDRPLHDRSLTLTANGTISDAVVEVAQIGGANTTAPIVGTPVSNTGTAHRPRRRSRRRRQTTPRS
jgi:hypothetical protein